MKNIKKILLVLFVLFSLTSCKSKMEKIYTKNTDLNKMSESIKKVNGVIENITIKDGSTIVYQKDTTATLNGSTLVSKVVEKTYTATGDFTTTETEKSTENFDTNSFFNYDLNKNYCVPNGHLYDNETLTLIIAKEYSQMFFKNNNFECMYNVTVNIHFTKKNLTSMDISYISTNSKNVSLSYTFNY